MCVSFKTQWILGYQGWILACPVVWATHEDVPQTNRCFLLEITIKNISEDNSSIKWSTQVTKTKDILKHFSWSTYLCHIIDIITHVSGHDKRNRDWTYAESWHVDVNMSFTVLLSFRCDLVEQMEISPRVLHISKNNTCCLQTHDTTGAIFTHEKIYPIILWQEWYWPIMIIKLFHHQHYVYFLSSKSCTPSSSSSHYCINLFRSGLYVRKQLYSKYTFRPTHYIHVRHKKWQKTDQDYDMMLFEHWTLSLCIIIIIISKTFTGSPQHIYIQHYDDVIHKNAWQDEAQTLMHERLRTEVTVTSSSWFMPRRNKVSEIPW